MVKATIKNTLSTSRQRKYGFSTALELYYNCAVTVYCVSAVKPCGTVCTYQSRYFQSPIKCCQGEQQPI